MDCHECYILAMTKNIDSINTDIKDRDLVNKLSLRNNPHAESPMQPTQTPPTNSVYSHS